MNSTNDGSKSRRDPLARLATSMTTASQTQVDPATMQEAVDFLHRYLGARFPSIQPVDLEDLVGEAVARVFAKSQDGSIRDHPNPAGYLLRTAENLTVDFLRSARHNREFASDVLPEGVLTDADAAAVFDERATVELVRAVLRRVRHSQDTILFQIATHVLNEAQRTGVVPSNRKIAQACNVSHTTVANALLRLRDHVTELSEGS